MECVLHFQKHTAEGTLQAALESWDVTQQGSGNPCRSLGSSTEQGSFYIKSTTAHMPTVGLKTFWKNDQVYVC